MTIRDNLIFDLGLHKGEDSEFYLKKGFNVIGVDALSELCDVAQNRLKKYVDSGQMVVLNYAIGDDDFKTIRFYKNLNNSVWGTTDETWVRRNRKMGTNSTPVEVSSIRLDTLIKKYGLPHYLKVDIEGVDFLAIKQLANLTVRPKYLSIESEKNSWKKLVSECDFLMALGYTKFKIINQRAIQEQKCPFPSLEGEFADHIFEPGSSGLFGKELPSQWMQYDECIKTYKEIFLSYKLFGDHSPLNNKYLRFVLRKLGIKFPEAGWYDTHVTF